MEKAPLTVEDVVRFVRDYNEIYTFSDDPPINAEEKEELVKYVEGIISFESLEPILNRLQAYPGKYLLSSMNGMLLNQRILPYPSPISERVYRLHCHVRDAFHLFYEQKRARKVTFDQLLQELDSYKINLFGIFASFYNYSNYEFFENSTIEEVSIALSNLANRNRDIVLAMIPELDAKSKTHLVPLLNKLDFNYFLKSIQDLAGDSSKAVREAVASVLAAHRDQFDYVEAALGSKKQALRETAIRILAEWNDEASQALLQQVYESEKNERLRSLIESAIKAKLVDASIEIMDLETYCFNQLNRKKNSIQDLPWEQLPKVRVQGVDTEQGPIICLKYLANCFAGTGRISVPLEAIKLAHYYDSADMAEWCLKLLPYWAEEGADAKKKWVLPLVAYCGDERIVSSLYKLISEWPLMGRSSIACEAVRALAVSDKDDALRLVDHMSRKFKSRSVRVASEEAFAYAANEQGIDPEELADRIVPIFGFSQQGELVLDFGQRTFTLRLNAKFEIDVYNGADKPVNALPKPGIDDDPEKAAAAHELYKEIKKGLKTAVKSQTLRLHSALTMGRTWTWPQWDKCFVQNPLMQRYACRLIWSACRQGSPIQHFRYLENGTFNTASDESYEVPQDAKIRLAHPIEMEQSEIDTWKAQLADYEVVQPLSQLHRGIFVIDSDMRKDTYIGHFGGRTMNGLKLMTNLLKLGWKRGPAGDGGMIDMFCREEPMCSYVAALAISGMYIAIDPSSEEEVTVYELVFLKRSNPKEDIRLYSTYDRNKVIRVGDAPERFISDIMIELEQATSGYERLDIGWKKGNWRNLD